MRRVEAANPSLTVGALNLVPEFSATFEHESPDVGTDRLREPRLLNQNLGVMWVFVIGRPSSGQAASKADLFRCSDKQWGFSCGPLIAREKALQSDSCELLAKLLQAPN